MAMIEQFKLRMWACLFLLASLLLAGVSTQTAQADASTAPEDSIANVVQFATGREFTCALTDAGAVQCWGGNDRGQLGNGTKGPSIEPVQVIGLESGVTAITAGASRACALRADGTVALSLIHI